MRSDAKASSAGSNQGQAAGLGSIVRGAFAGRGAPAGAGGSSAPSGRAALLAIGVLAALLLAPAASANVFTRAQTAHFGADGTADSSLPAPSATAFDQTSSTLYVESSSPGQIHAFDIPAHTPSGGSFPIGSGQMHGRNLLCHRGRQLRHRIGRQHLPRHHQSRPLRLRLRRRRRWAGIFRFRCHRPLARRALRSTRPAKSSSPNSRLRRDRSVATTPPATSSARSACPRKGTAPRRSHSTQRTI